MALDMAFTINPPSASPPGDADFVVEVYPASASVLPGQNVQFRVTSTSGTGAIDEFESLFFEYDFGDPGATVDYAQDTVFTDANRGFGRVCAKAWETPGVKTITVRMFDITGTLKTKTLDVTVRDPAVEVWTDEYYVDFGEVSGAPDFSTAPAAGPNVHHITSWAELAAVDVQWAENAKFTFKRGETFTINTTDTLALQGSNYVLGKDSSFQIADADPKLISGVGTNASHTAFAADGVAYADDTLFFNHSVFYGIEFISSYDPVVFGAPSGAMTCIRIEKPNEGDISFLSLFKCKSTKCAATVLSTGGANNGGHKVVLANDCDINEWYDWGFGLFGGTTSASIENCRIRQSPYAVPWDGKSGVSGSPDHGVIRTHAADWYSFSNNSGGNSSGWVSQGGTRAIQPIGRLYQDSAGAVHGHPPEVIANILFNNFGGANFFDIGMNTTGQSKPAGEARIVIDGNRFVGGGESVSSFVRVLGITGVYIRNNVYRRANVYSGLQRRNSLIKFEAVSFSDDLPGTQTRPFIIAGNTIISQKTAATGDNNDFSIIFVGGSGVWNGTQPITLRDNIVKADGHANGASFTDYGPLDPANGFRPVSGSAAIGAASGDRKTVFDASGGIITGPANIGAFDQESATAGTVAAPVNLMPPTIAEHPAEAGRYYVSDFGLWENLEPNDEFTFGWEWRVDGAIGLGRFQVQLYEPGSQTGALTCNFIATNASGVRVIVPSANSILLS